MTIYVLTFISLIIFCCYYAFVKRNRFRAAYEEGEIQDLTTPVFLKKGRKIWEGNLQTGEVCEAKIMRDAEVEKHGLTRIVINANCIYVDAINKHNAERKIIDKLEKRLGKK